MLIIKGKLLDTGMETPMCGDEHYVVIMLYEVMQVIEGSYDNSRVLVGHSCPEQREKDFQIGLIHLLNLTTNFPVSGTIANKFEKETVDLGIKYCTGFTVVR